MVLGMPWVSVHDTLITFSFLIARTKTSVAQSNDTGDLHGYPPRTIPTVWVSQHP